MVIAAAAPAGGQEDKRQRCRESEEGERERFLCTATGQGGARERLGEGE